MLGEDEDDGDEGGPRHGFLPLVEKQEKKREARSPSNPSNMIYSPKKKSAKVHSHKSGRAGGGRGGDDHMTSFSNKDLKMLEVRQDYDFNQRPDNPVDQGKPLNCNISVNLRNVLQVDEITQIVTMEVSLRLHWFDERIKIAEETLQSMGQDEEYVTLNPRLAKYFWIPDIFIDQAKELREPTFHVLPASLRIYRNSMVRYAARVNFDVACNMDFRSFPGDSQVCDIKLESFAYTTNQLVFNWMNNSNVNENISLAQFDLRVLPNQGYGTDYYELSYPGLIFTLVLRRKLSYHVVQTYIPSTIYLTVSWLALFVPPQSIAERLAMAMTIMLTLTAMFASERQNVPRVSYVTYLDVWMLGCIFFVLMELVEFTLVLRLLKSEGAKSHQHASNVEKTSRVLLPVIFFGFNAAYWSVVANERMNQAAFLEEASFT